VTGRGDALLQGPHLAREGGLVTYGGGHAAQEGGDFGAGLGKTEDVVDKKQHVASGSAAVAVAEAFGDGQGRKGYAGAGAGWFVHLSEYHTDLTVLQGL
jgi:hypothetical protein